MGYSPNKKNTYETVLIRNTMRALEKADSFVAEYAELYGLDWENDYRNTIGELIGIFDDRYNEILRKKENE